MWMVSEVGVMGLLSEVLSDDDGHGKPVYEDAKFRYWSNSQTLTYEKQMHEYDPQGIAPVEVFKVYLIEEKSSGRLSYVAFNKKGEPFMDWTDPYTFDFKMVLFRDDIRNDCDVVNMAKKRKEKKKRAGGNV